MARKCFFTPAGALQMAIVATVYIISQSAVAQSMGDMSGTKQPDRMEEMIKGPSVPPVKGIAEGQEIFFIHTEASDPKVAKLLTDMMGSPVLVVPSLSQIPESLLANVFVFTNGIEGGGPMGFQPDVFDRPPGDPGYTPLRALNLVTWKEKRTAKKLKTAALVRAAESGKEVTISRPGVVINMPFLTWPGGHR